MNFFTQQETAIHTFRNLPPRTKNKLELRDIMFILAQKANYYTALSYSQKCKTSVDKIAGVLYRKFKKSGWKTGQRAIQNVLVAEEDYYRQLNSIYF